MVILVFFTKIKLSFKIFVPILTINCIITLAQVIVMIFQPPGSMSWDTFLCENIVVHLGMIFNIVKDWRAWAEYCYIWQCDYLIRIEIKKLIKEKEMRLNIDRSRSKAGGHLSIHIDEDELMTKVTQLMPKASPGFKSKAI